MNREDKYNDDIKKLHSDLQNLAIPNVNENRRFQFKEELKNKLMFQCDKKANEKKTSKFTFRKLFSHAFVTAVLLPFMVIGSVSAYAYTSPSVYEGHILFPVKIVMEEIEFSMVNTPEEKVEKKIKLASRRLEEAKVAYKDKSTVGQGTLKGIANYTLSAYKDLEDIDSEEERQRLTFAIKDFSEKQINVLSAITDVNKKEVLAVAYDSYLDNKLSDTFSSSKNKNEEIEKEIEDNNHEVIEKNNKNVRFDMGYQLDSANKEHGDIHDRDVDELVMADTDIENNDLEETFMLDSNTTNTTSSDKYKEGNNDLEETSISASDTDIVSNSNNEEYGKEYRDKEESKFISEAESGKKIDDNKERQILMAHDNITGAELDNSSYDNKENKKIYEKEALDYIWNISNRLMNIEDTKLEIDSSINANEKMVSTMGGNNKSLYKPRLKFYPSLDTYEVENNVYLLEVDKGISFYINEYFVDDLGLDVPGSIFKDNVEIFMTNDNSDPFSSSTKKLYRSGDLLNIDRDVILKFVAVTDEYISPTYTIQISVVDRGSVDSSKINGEDQNIHRNNKKKDKNTQYQDDDNVNNQIYIEN